MQYKKPKQKEKLIDFNSAYKKRNGRQPKPIERTLMVDNITAMDKLLSPDPKKIIVEINLEDKSCKQDYSREVRTNDQIIVRAGRCEFRLAFAQIDSNGNLVTLALINKERFDFTPSISSDGNEKVWSGLLSDKRYFEIRVKRIPTYSIDPGVIANVEITAKVNRAAY